MNVLDLFSGIGGFSLGLERAGMRTVAFCERDEFCRAVLRKHWPTVPCFNDVRTLDAARLAGLGRIDLVCGGFPCQPFSHAGAQRAQADDRHLWPAMREVIALARPAWVIGENVAGIITLALDDVLADLENNGYAPQAFVIPAVAVDAHHQRKRVWIIARDTHGDRKPALPINAEMAELCGVAADSDSTELRLESGRGRGSRRAGAPKSRDHGSEKSLAYTSGEHEQGEFARGFDTQKRAGSVERPPRSCGDGERRWLPEPDVGRVANGVPARMDRLKALGNAVVPQVVEEIGRAIMRCSQ